MQEYVVPDLEDYVRSESGILSAPSVAGNAACVTVGSGVVNAGCSEGQASWDLVNGSDYQPTELDGHATTGVDAAGSLGVDEATPAHVFDRVLEQAHISNLNASQTSLPWESGVHAAIFSDVWEPAQLNQLTFAMPPPVADEGDDEPEAVLSATAKHLKRKKEVAVCDSVIKSIADVDFKQERENLWNRGLNKWILVYSCIQGTRAWSKIVLESDIGSAMEVLRDVLGAKSPKTMNKRRTRCCR